MRQLFRGTRSYYVVARPVRGRFEFEGDAAAVIGQESFGTVAVLAVPACGGNG